MSSQYPAQSRPKKPLSVEARPLRALLVSDSEESVGTIGRELRYSGFLLSVARTLAEARLLLTEITVDVAILELSLRDGRGESLLPDLEACRRQPGAIIIGATIGELELSALQYRPFIVTQPVDPKAFSSFARTIALGFANPIVGRFSRRFHLTEREAAATTFAARGLRPKEVADRMNCGEKVIYAHLSRACKKTGCRDYHEMVGMLLSFSLQALGHTPPEHPAFRSPDE
jgi:DNA-binding CsgD family transcriptional regulator